MNMQEILTNADYSVCKIKNFKESESILFYLWSLNE